MRRRSRSNVEARDPAPGTASPSEARLRAFFFLACAVLLAAGCGAPSGRAGDPPLLRVRLGSDPPTLDPARAVDAASVAVISQVFDGLTEMDPSSGEPRPCLARSWSVSPDGLTYTFHLREEARFHTGRAVEATDVVYSLERLLDPAIASQRRWLLTGILGADAFWSEEADHVAGLRAADPLTVVVTLASPDGSLPARLALEGASILPREVYADPIERYLEAPVGAGPFRFERWEHGSTIELRAHEGHHLGKPGVAGLLYRILPSAATALEEYLAGGLDVLDEIPGGRRAEIASRLPREFRHHTQPALAFLAFNHAAPPFRGNRALRQALNLAIDRRSLCETLQEGKDVAAAGILPPGVAGAAGEVEGLHPFDPEAARSKLAEAGYPGGDGLPEVVLAFNTSETHRRVCQRIQSDLGRIGVKVRLVEMDPAALMQAIAAPPGSQPAIHLFRMAWLADIPDPDAFLRPTLHSSSSPEAGNFARYANPSFDEALDRARAEVDGGRRLALYREAERIAIEDAAWVLLYFYGDDALVSTRVTDLVIPRFGEFLAPLHLARFRDARAPGSTRLATPEPR